WESVCSHLYDTIESYGDLKKFILSGTVNERIFSMKNILPDIVGLLTDPQRKELSDILKTKIHDDTLCDIGGSYSYADNEDTCTVGHAANNALSLL
ncbi:MAG: hypothetical protein ABIF10_03385, partial [Candidatus Woesearchaeota archaeon]